MLRQLAGFATTVSSIVEPAACKLATDTRAIVQAVAACSPRRASTFTSPTISQADVIIVGAGVGKHSTRCLLFACISAPLALPC
jgi:hypothetical protein